MTAAASDSMTCDRTASPCALHPCLATAVPGDAADAACALLRRAATAPDDANRSFAAAIAPVCDAVAIASKDDVIRFACCGIATLFGTPVASLVGKRSVRSLVAPDDGGNLGTGSALLMFATAYQTVRFVPRLFVTAADGRTVAVSLAILDVSFVGRRFSVHLFSNHGDGRTDACTPPRRSQVDAVIANAPDGICVLDARSRIAYANDAFLDMLGLDGDAVAPGTPACDLIALARTVGNVAPEDSACWLCPQFDRRLGLPADLAVETLRDGRAIRHRSTPIGRGYRLTTLALLQ